MSAAAANPVPSLGSGKVGPGQRLRDLGWLVRSVYRRTPGPSAAWIAAAIVSGILPPIGIWAGQGMIDAVQDRLDGVAGSSPWPWLVVAIVSLVGVRFVDIARFYVESIVRERAPAAIQGEVMRRTTEVDLAAYEDQDFYNTSSRIATEMENRALKIVTIFQDLLVSIPYLAGVLIVLWSIDWRITLIAAIPTIPGFIIQFRLGESIWGFIQEQTRDRRISFYLADQLASRQAAKEVRLFGLGRYLLDRWSHHYVNTRAELRWRQFRAQLRGQIFGQASYSISLAFLLWIIFGLDATYSAGEIVVLMTTFLSVPGHAIRVAQYLNELGESSGLASDARALLAYPAPFAHDGSIVTRPESGAGRMEFRHVSFAYPATERRVIDDLSLTIEPGQRVAVVGENGAGKTTLLKLALGLFAPDTGEILIDRRPVRDIPLPERHALFSAVFQQFTRYPFSARENIALDRSYDDGAIVDALATTGMQDVVKSMPNGIETVLSPDLGGVDLSGGQWQRLAIARAGLRGASILALDEPTAALDPMAEVEIFGRFAALAEGRTTLLVSHRLGMCRMADRIVVIEHGRVTEDGPHGELVGRSGHYAHLWEMQSRWYL